MGRIFFLSFAFFCLHCYFTLAQTFNQTSNNNQLTPSTEFTYFSLKTPLIPQKGNFSCWAATLQMMGLGENQNRNKLNTSPIRTDSLSKLLGIYKSNKYARISDPSWDKIKSHLIANKGLVTYKYYNEKFAHVFLVKGFQESQNTKWLLVNDPWPVGKAKITALSFNQFIRPFNGTQEYQSVKYSASSKSNSEKSEPVFNIYSSSSLIGTNPIIYFPPKVSVDKKIFSVIREKEIVNLVQQQVELFKDFDASLYADMNIEINVQKLELSKDMGSLLRLNQFTNTLSFLKYDLKASKKSDYLFDGLKLAFVNLNNKRKALISLTIEYENKSEPAYLYVSRFEKYATSERAEWDKIEREFRVALNNPSIKTLLNGTEPKPRNTNVSGNGPAIEDEYIEDDEIYEMEDISMLPLYGGMVYSFTWPPFDEKIVADPYRQLKMGHKAIFVSNTGTPYYRLSDAEIPEWGEIVEKESKIEVEWLGINRLKNDLDSRKEEIDKLKERTNRREKKEEILDTPPINNKPRGGKKN